MNPLLSVIIASHNDPQETVLTINSIRETVPKDGEVEIVVVDDCSATALTHYIKPEQMVRLVTNRLRCGCGPSRHIGALAARAPWLLICDSHMRFTKDWYVEWDKLLMAQSLAHSITAGNVIHYSKQSCGDTVFCATCLGLDSKHMDVEHPVSKYHGATLNLYGPDRNNAKAPMQVYEAVWLPREPEPQDGQELAAVMGACYFVSREWFLKLSATRFLYPWGCDEQNLSIATWLAGGTVRLAKHIEVGHKFLLPNERQTFGVTPGCVVFNKMASMASILPHDLATKLIQLLLASTPPRDREPANRMFRDMHFLVATQKAHFESIFVRSFDWYCGRFGIALP